MGKVNNVAVGEVERLLVWANLICWLMKSSDVDGTSGGEGTSRRNDADMRVEGGKNMRRRTRYRGRKRQGR
jgi:hypothetical protein